jgi:hypothetical protein
MKKKNTSKPKRSYSQDVIGLMEMLRDIGHTPVTRFGGLKATKKALGRSNRRRKP